MSRMPTSYGLERSVKHFIPAIKKLIVPKPLVGLGFTKWGNNLFGDRLKTHRKHLFSLKTEL